LLKYLKEEDYETISKVLFTGLDFAGKSSIILTLKREFAQIGDATPTQGSQKRMFDFLGRQISEWDLGGQRKYRISYLKRPNDYFANTNVAIYVIDIQDETRFDESIDYLHKVIKKFEELEISPFVHIFFHKYDPTIVQYHDNQYENIVENLKEQIKEKISYKNIDFHKTSIFDISSIIKSMSSIFLSLVPKTVLIDTTLQEFVEKTNSKGIIIVDDNSLMISSYFIDDEVKMLAKDSIPYFLSLNDSFEKVDVESLGDSQNSDKTTVIQKNDNYFIFSKIDLNKDAPPYYLLLVKDTPEYDKKNIQSISTLFGEILY
jgi:GTPase SAR1 family protein